jgi:hypothetical protein
MGEDFWLIFEYSKDYLKIKKNIYGRCDRRYGLKKLVTIAYEYSKLNNNLTDIIKKYAIYLGDHSVNYCDLENIDRWFCMSQTIENIKNNINIFPEYGFYQWDSAYEGTFTNKIINLHKIYEEKPIILDKIVWAGSLQCGVRNLFSIIASSRQDLFKCEVIEWSLSYLEDGRAYQKPSNNFMTIEEQSKYRAIIDIEGYGYSGRTKILLHTGRPLLLVDRLLWDWPMHLLIPWIHFIPVNQNLSNLIEQAEWIFNNKEKADEIGRNALEFAKIHFTTENAIKRVCEILEEKL